MTRLKNGILIFLGLFLVSCQTGARREQPPEIRLGTDPCDECHMIINEARYAAAYVTAKGTTRRFDDIGCLLIYHNRQSETVETFWFRDYQNGNWMKTDNAWFVYGEDLATPMGYGIVAASDKQRAEQLAVQNNAQIFTFKKLKKVVSLRK